MGRPKGSKNRIKNFLIKAGYEEIEKKPEPQPEIEPAPKPEIEKAPSFVIKCKRSTKLMYEVLPWAMAAKYNELAVTE